MEPTKLSRAFAPMAGAVVLHADRRMSSLPLPSPPSAALSANKTRQRNRKKPRRPRATTNITDIATRAQQDSHLYNLTLNVQQLRQQLQDLARHRQLLSARAALSFFSPQPHDAILRAAVQYFQGFSRGYRGALANPQQCALVHALAHEQLSLGITGFGVGMLLEQWRRYTTLFHVHTTALHTTQLLTISSSNREGSGSNDHVLVKCVTTFHGVFTREAVDAVFPSAQREPSLLVRVLGAQLELPLVFHLYFSTSGQLMRHDAEADFLGIVCRALDGDMQAAVRFMGHARVGAESMVGPLPIDTQKARNTSKRLASRHGGDDSDPEEETEEEEAAQGAQSPCNPSAWVYAATAGVDVVVADEKEQEKENEVVDGEYQKIYQRRYGAADGDQSATSSSRHSLSFLLS